jgi:outer membrane protein assembly factor BamB
MDDELEDDLPDWYTVRAEELLVWKHAVPGTGPAVFRPPFHTDRPNPAVVGDLVIASVFSPHWIYAVDRATGAFRWRVDLPTHSGAAVYEADGIVYAACSQGLIAIEPTTGEVRWFADVDDWNGQSVWMDGVVVCGDGNARLHGIDAATGKHRWWRETSRTWDNLLVVERAGEHGVAAPHHFRHLRLYDGRDGREIWRRRLSGKGTIRRALVSGDSLYVAKQSALYRLSIELGEVLDCRAWRGREITSLAVAGDTWCVASTTFDWSNPCENATWDLIGGRGTEPLWRLPYQAHGEGSLRFDEATGLLYEACYGGLGIVDPQRGERLHVVGDFEPKEPGGMGQPAYADGCLYVLTQGGTLYALRHP